MAKVILIGEHSILYGGLALVVPFDKKVYVNIRKANTPFFSYDKAYMELVYKIVGKTPYITIDVKNTVPKEKGLGSSASFALSITKALLKYYKKSMSDNQIYELCKEYEDKIHRPSSGMDIAVQMKNKPIIYSKDKVEDISFSFGINVVILDTFEKGSTQKAIKTVKNSINFEKEIDNLKEYAKNAVLSTKNKDKNIFLEQIKKAQKSLEKLDIVSDKAKNLIQETLKNKALASKISGSGLGGIVISFVEDNHLNDFLKTFKKESIGVFRI